MESRDNNHFKCGVDDLHTTVCVKEGWLCIHDPVSHDGGVVVMGLLPHQVDATGGCVY